MPETFRASLGEITTTWSPPWLTTVLAQLGDWHQTNKQPMQDAHRVSSCGPHLILCVADGVSSRPQSHWGARAAVAAAQSYLQMTLATQRPSTDDVLTACAAGHDALARLAEANSCEITEFATTLIVAVLTDTHVAAAGIGDSSILTYVHTTPATPPKVAPFLALPQPPGKGIYSLADPAWRQHTHARALAYPRLKALLLATDGAESLFTQPSDTDILSPFSPNLVHALDAIVAKITPRRLFTHWAVQMATHGAAGHDDRTLLLAFRPTPPLDISE